MCICNNFALPQIVHSLRFLPTWACYLTYFETDSDDRHSLSLSSPISSHFRPWNGPNDLIIAVCLRRFVGMFLGPVKMKKRPKDEKMTNSIVQTFLELVKSKVAYLVLQITLYAEEIMHLQPPMLYHCVQDSY